MYARYASSGRSNRLLIETPLTTLAPEVHQLIESWRQLSEVDRRRALRCVHYLQEADEEIIHVARQQLDILDQVAYVMPSKGP
jgi:hypothetical protein